ncbi:enoyl-CoA hydratase-related protein [Vagococcus bubulae]|uniref:Crotonase n=1 Tax=Vagococcus bubulae TaxID=1977868 RepID=A0A429ZL43_9ENTE|nr:enoyl-CoA hydratase-related protein [Vagococcus bubulae]RST94414.1 crotonase [Vagococcus bubulae]
MTRLSCVDYKKEDEIGILTINRPEALNALNTEVLEALEIILEKIEEEDIKLLVITGNGEKAFVAGADITEMSDMNTMQAKVFSEKGNRVFSKIETFKIPVIAAVNGFALGGGCELALSADIRIASYNAKFGQPEVGLGIIPGFGGTQRLSRTVGMPKAKELIFSGKIISAEEAERIGLVNEIVEAEELMTTTLELAKKIAKQAPLAVEMSKKVMNEGINMTISQGLDYEAASFGALFSTEDQKEGMYAFIEKRKPKFETR